MNIFKNQVKVTQNSYKDEGEGIVSFKNGLVISDSNVQRNGTRYEIESLDTSHYNMQLTADHEDKLKNIIGRVEGLEKKDGVLTVNRIVYAVKQNPYARLAYDLLVGGFSNAFSTETMGVTDTDGVLRNHELVGLSQVVCPNNYSAVINTVRNSLEKAKEDGLDTNGIEDLFLNNVIKEIPMDDEKNKEPVVEQVEDRVESPAPATDEALEDIALNSAKKEDKEEEKAEEKSSEKEEMPEEDEKTEAEAESESEDEDEKKKSKKQENDISSKEADEINRRLDALMSLVEELRKGKKDEMDVEDVVLDLDNKAKKAKNEAEKEEPVVEETPVEPIEEVENSVEETNEEEETPMDKEEIKNAVQEVLKNYFKDEAKAPEFKKDEGVVENSYESMDWRERYNKQVNAAFEAMRLNSVSAQKTLAEINEVNFNSLKKEGIVRNSMTIASMGNFVIPTEMYREIVGKRTDYSALLDATTWRETNSLEFAWLKRNGDIDMKNVAMCDDGNNGNLKPVSEYSAEPVTSKLEEMAAVTVICNAATRFFAVDLLADVAAGYRNDYDRKRAQLIVARLEQAVDENQNSVKYSPATDTEAMLSWLEAIASISDATPNGTLVFNNKTWANLKAHALAAGTNGPLSQIFVDGELPRIFGTNIIIVPNDLMPTIESNDDIHFMVDGEDVKIDHAVFYADLSEFTGYTSGGLQYDVDASASYEVGGAVRSAYQRNELVLRGSFFRGGAIKDTSRVAGIEQQTA